MVIEVGSGELTPVEKSLAEHVGRGEWLDLAADDEVLDEAAMRSWDESRTCRAVVIRDILRGKHAGDPDPHGLRLRGARITGRLDLESLTTDVSLELKDCLLQEGVLARDAHLAVLGLTGCRLEHPTEPPLDAARLTCTTLDLSGARVIGHADCGAVRLMGAHIGGGLHCDGAELRNDSGPALAAEGLEVGQHMFFRRLTVTGGGDAGAVRLVGARIVGQLDCEGAKLRNDSGPALQAYGLQVGGSMFLRNGFAAAGGGDDVAVNLVGSLVGGPLYLDPALLEHAADPYRRLDVDGLTYAGVAQGISAWEWLDLLRHGTPRYAAQPYQQLAAGYRAMGNERQARQILMAQRNDELIRAPTSRREQLWGWITKVTLGYGYKPWLALVWLLGVVILSCVLAVVLGWHGALAQTSMTAAPGRPCTVVQRLSVGVDLNLPVGTSVAGAGCGLAKDAASVTAGWLAMAGWVLRLLAWVFAALFIAGFTSAVRKT